MQIKVKEALTLIKPTFVGMDILDLSKTLMCKFPYNYIKKNYGHKTKLFFTYTGKLTFKIEANDV